MLKIAEYNTITGEKVELKDLEKYGFTIKYDEYTGEPNILEKRFLIFGFPTPKITFKKKIRIRIFSDKIFWVSSFENMDKDSFNKWQDTLYDLIKDGFIIKED